MKPRRALKTATNRSRAEPAARQNWQQSAEEALAAAASRMPVGHDGRTASNVDGPSAARDARLAVIRHAAASHTTLSGLLAARPSHMVLGEERLRELQDQLMHGGPKQPHWAVDAEPIHPSPLRPSLLGVRCTEAWVVACIFRTELWTVEQDRVGAVGMVVAELERARAGSAAASEESRRREGALHEQLALATHECWAAREEIQTAKRVAAEQQVGIPTHVRRPPFTNVHSPPHPPHVQCPLELSSG